MKYVRNVMFFVFIIIIFASLWINIIIITSQKTTQTDVLDTVKVIYFDKSKLPQETQDKINELINSNNSITFSRLIESKNPVKAFYGFCGFMKGNQKQAMKYLDGLLISTKKVDIFVNNNKTNTTLGYAILLLIKTFPEHLTNPPIEDFYSLSEKAISKAYKSQIVKISEEYNKQLVQLISEKYPNITIQTTETTTTTTTTAISYDNISSRTPAEKITISSTLADLSPSIKEKAILQLITENNETITKNILNSLNDKDTQTAAEAVFKILEKDNSYDTASIVIRKYSSILKANSITGIQEYMKNNLTNEKILLVCLQAIYDYGNESSYEFLKIFLEPRYTADFNLMGLRTIVQTTYKTNPASVLKTLMFAIRYLNVEQLAYYSIDFCMRNSISEGAVTVVLPRLSKKDTLEMRKLALDYIEHFKLKDGLTLIQELSSDSDPDIQQKAKDLLEKMKTW
jgi:hypothetical protein